MRFWNYNTGVLDIFLVWELNKAGQEIEYIRPQRPYSPCTRDITGMKKITFNHQFVYDRKIMLTHTIMLILKIIAHPESKVAQAREQPQL